MTVNDLSITYLFIRKYHCILFSFEIINLRLFYRFRGGKEDEWKSGTDGYIYYNNFFVRQISK